MPEYKTPVEVICDSARKNLRAELDREPTPEELSERICRAIDFIFG